MIGALLERQAPGRTRRILPTSTHGIRNPANPPPSRVSKLLVHSTSGCVQPVGFVMRNHLVAAIAVLTLGVVGTSEASAKSFWQRLGHDFGRFERQVERGVRHDAGLITKQWVNQYGRPYVQRQLPSRIGRYW